MYKYTVVITFSVMLVAAAAITDTSPENKSKHDGKESPGQPYMKVEEFHEQNIEGWTVMVEKKFTAEHPELSEKTLRIISNQLFRIKRVVPAAAVEKLQKVKIWVQYDHPFLHNCQYHPSHWWLKNHRVNTAKQRCVDLPNARGFISSTIRQPCVMLHELAHAYHHRELGFDNAEVIEAYKRMKKAGIYEKVTFWDGRETRHYALTDHKEYFAESTEALFGTNDFYPFVRGELRRHDPKMYKLLRRLWGVDKPKSKTRPAKKTAAATP